MRGGNKTSKWLNGRTLAYSAQVPNKRKTLHVHFGWCSWRKKSGPELLHMTGLHAGWPLGWCLGTWILAGFPPTFVDKRLALPKLCKQYGLCWTPAFLLGVSNWCLCQAEAACVTGPFHKKLDVESLMSSLGDNISTSSRMEKSFLEVSCVSILEQHPGTCVPGSSQSAPLFSFFLLSVQTFVSLWWVFTLTGCPTREFPNLGVLRGSLSMQCWISYLWKNASRENTTLSNGK